MTQTQTRSPYFIHTSVSGMTSADLDIYIYTGEQTTDRGAVTYALSRTAISNKVTFEISELIRDYIAFSFDGSYVSECVWVDYQLTTYGSGTVVNSIVPLVAFDGFGNFTQGVQNQDRNIKDSNIMQSNINVYKLEGYNNKLPLNASADFLATAYDVNGEILNDLIVSNSTNTSNKIIYFGASTTSDNVKYRVEKDGGTFEASTCLTDFLNSLDNDATSYNIGGNTIIVEDICETKYTPQKLTFINSFGAKQDLWLFKSKKESLKIEDSSYDANIITDGSYSVLQHQKNILNKAGATSLELSSGFYLEENNVVFEELLLSELVWLTEGSLVLPVIITDSSFAYKTVLNDKLVKYSIKLDFAFNKINSVR